MGEKVIIPTNKYQTPITQELLDQYPQEVQDQKCYTVYRHISPSGRVYVGITKLPLLYRWGLQGFRYKRCKLFYRAIQKYGWNKIVHEIILDGVSKSEAVYTERYLIRWYKIHDLSYNITDGGESTAGIHMPEDAKEKISIYMRRRKSRSVLQYSINGDFVREYESAKEAARILGCGHTSVSNCASGKKSHLLLGYIFIYKDEIDSLPEVLVSYFDHWSRYRIVQCLNGIPLNSFKSVREAEKVTGVNRICIRNNIRGKFKRAGKYTWKRVMVI